MFTLPRPSEICPRPWADRDLLGRALGARLRFLVQPDADEPQHRGPRLDPLARTDPDAAADRLADARRAGRARSRPRAWTWGPPPAAAGRCRPADGCPSGPDMRSESSALKGPARRRTAPPAARRASLVGREAVGAADAGAEAALVHGREVLLGCGRLHHPPAVPGRQVGLRERRAGPRGGR